MNVRRKGTPSAAGHAASGVCLEMLEPRLLLSATSGLLDELAGELATTGVIERSAETEHLFSPDDTQSDGIVILTGQPAEGSLAEDGVWWNWSGSISIPDGPGGAWVGINCLSPGTLPSGNAVTRVVLHHEITHTWIGDLEVMVYNSTHTWIVRDNDGGSADNVNETVTAWTLFDGDDPVQDWYYRVRDTQALDTGTLTVMQLYVYYDTRVNTAPVINGVPDVTLDEDGQFPEPPAGVERLGFDADTSAWQAAADDPASLDDATPTGSSYMLIDNHGGSWSDVEKSPVNTEDDLMCWAAAASNVLEWTGWGLVSGMTTTDQIFAYFLDHWTDVGGMMEYGWDWWFDGTNPSQGWAGWSQVDVPGGGFYPTEIFSNYYHHESSDSVTLNAIDQYLHAGYGVTLGLYGGGGHAITCWGYNYNPADTDDYYGVWVTDSDDYKSQVSPPDMLRYYEVEYTSGQWYLQDYYGSGAWYIGEVQALEQNPDDPTPDPTPGAIDLWNYASDAETADADLLFTLIGNTNPNCGVIITANRYIEVHPAANWNGTSTVTVRVSDGSLTDTDVFTVTVSAVNDAPTLTGIPDRSLRQDTRLYYTTDLWSYAADADHWDWQLTFGIVGNTNANCGVSIAAGHYIQIIPTAGWTGTSDVTVQVSDGDLVDTDVFQVTVEPATVDLTGAFATVSLGASPMAGTWGYAIVNVNNIGNTARAGTMDLQLWATSDGDVTTLAGVGDYLLTTARRYMYVPAGGSSQQVLYYTLPQGMAADDYRLALVVDSSNEVVESNETNNTALTAGQYQVREAFVDLTGAFVVVSLTAAPAPGTWGYAIVDVHNDGNVARTGYMDLQLWATSDGDVTTLAGVGDYLLTTTRPYMHIAAGGFSRQVFYYTLPAGMTPGNYRLALVVDSSGEVVESDDNNNTTLTTQEYAVGGVGTVLAAVTPAPASAPRLAVAAPPSATVAPVKASPAAVVTRESAPAGGPVRIDRMDVAAEPSPEPLRREPERVTHQPWYLMTVRPAPDSRNAAAASTILNTSYAGRYPSTEQAFEMSIEKSYAPSNWNATAGMPSFFEMYWLSTS